jgi:hypothetical protein
MLVLKVLKVLLALKVQLVLQEFKEPQDLLGNQDLKDLLVHKVPRV